VLASQLKDEGCSAVATVHPPTKATKATAAEIRPHQGTQLPAATGDDDSKHPGAGGDDVTAPCESRGPEETVLGRYGESIVPRPGG
jgi:hypothetical protein